MTRRVEMIMGTAVSLDLPDTGVPAARRAAAADEAFAWFREVDARFSPYRPDSEVCAPRRAMSADMRAVLDACEEPRARPGRTSGGSMSWIRSPGGRSTRSPRSP